MHYHACSDSLDGEPTLPIIKILTQTPCMHLLHAYCPLPDADTTHIYDAPMCAVSAFEAVHGNVCYVSL